MAQMTHRHNYLRREALGNVDDVQNAGTSTQCRSRQICLLITISYQPIDKASIEIVTSSYCRYHFVKMPDRNLRLDECVGIGQIGDINPHGTSAIGTNENFAKRADVLNINLSTVSRTIKITKIFGRTSHYCRKSDILFQIAQDSRDVLDVALSEIDVVVKDGPCIMSSSKKGTSVIANDGID